MNGTTTRRRRIAIALLGAVVAASGLAVVGATSASASDGAMFSQVNSARASRGLPTYAWSSHLAAVAAGQAQRMASKRELYHNPNLAGDVGSYRWVGENVGYGPNSSVIQSAFMNSAPHRANILDTDYTEIGIASAKDSKGRLWVAQVFRQPVGSASVRTHKAPSHKKTTTTRTGTRTRTHAANALATAAANRAAAARANAAKPKVVRKPVVRPAPQPTLAQRVSYASEQTAATGTDPLADALAFAATMNAVAG